MSKETGLSDEPIYNRLVDFESIGAGGVSAMMPSTQQLAAGAFYPQASAFGGAQPAPLVLLSDAQAALAAKEAEIAVLKAELVSDESKAAVVRLHLHNSELRMKSLQAMCKSDQAEIADPALVERKPLNAAKRRSPPLTAEQIDKIHLTNSDAYERGDVDYESHGFARAIEAAHGITVEQGGA